MMIYRCVAMFILPDADFADDAEERRSFIVSNMPNFEPPTNKEKYNNPLFGRFSISSEILIDFGLTLFTVLAPLFDNRKKEVRSPFRKACKLITENRKHRQSDKP